MLNRKTTGGDTLIEVIFAFTVFSLLAVGAITIMNQGTATAQKALEITLVRQQIDAQTEAIRYIHGEYMSSLSGASDPDAVDAWTKIIGQKSVAKATTFGVGANGKCSAIAGKKFILNAHNGNLETTLPLSSNDLGSTPYAQVVYGGNNDPNVVSAAYGIWIEAVRGEAVQPQNYTDFHIRACWYGPTSGPAITLGTIVRLYAPTN